MMLPMMNMRPSWCTETWRTGRSNNSALPIIPGIPCIWEFVSSDSKLIRKGYEPPIHDFAIMDEYGSDLVDDILSDPGYTLFDD